MWAVLLKNEELFKIKSELLKRICKFRPILQKESPRLRKRRGCSVKSKGPRWVIREPFAKKESDYEKIHAVREVVHHVPVRLLYHSRARLYRAKDFS